MHMTYAHAYNKNNMLQLVHKNMVTIFCLITCMCVFLHVYLSSVVTQLSVMLNLLNLSLKID